MITQALVLLILLNIGHWLSDYTHLSTPWMLSAKRFGKPLLPILAHAGVHANQVFWLTFFVVDDAYVALYAALFQLVTHFAIDVLKGRLNGWFPALQSPTNPYHWYIFGVDQFLHQLVILLTTYYALK